MSDPRAKAIPYLRERADAGDPEAQFKLGECYRDGIGVSKELTEAKRWLQAAANTGHQGAMAALEGLQPPTSTVPYSPDGSTSTPTVKTSSSTDDAEGRGCVFAGIAGFMALGFFAKSCTKTTGALWWTTTETDWGPAIVGTLVIAAIAYNVAKNWK